MLTHLTETELYINALHDTPWQSVSASHCQFWQILLSSIDLPELQHMISTITISLIELVDYLSITSTWARMITNLSTISNGVWEICLKEKVLLAD